MLKLNRSRAMLAAMLGMFGVATISSGQVVINELQWDDSGTDNIEFAELFNPGAVSIDISGWTLGGRDASGLNAIQTIPGVLNSGTTMIGPGGFYVIANTGVINVNQVAAAGFFENDAETVELRSDVFATGTLVDAVVYESNKGAASHGVLPGDVAGQVAGGYWGNHQGIDLAPPAPNLSTRNSVARHSDGYDTNNNGRDFSNRRATIGTANSAGVIASYTAPNVDGLANGVDAPGMTGVFVTPRVIDPTVVDANNPSAIPAPPNSTKAIVAWDPAGGGNGASANSHSVNGGGFDIVAYLDTGNIPINSNTAGTLFRGVEETFYGFGGGDALTNLADISGAVGLTGIGANGFSGLAWYYEKAGETSAASNDVVENLYLVDAGDGGDSVSNGGMDWIVLATVDMTSTASGWFNLSISVDAAGNGVATFGTSVFNFTTAAALVGEFAVGYRENTQIGAVGVPSFVRPATYAPVPEPASLAAAGLLGATLLRRRK